MSKEWALVERSTWDHLNAVASSEIALNPQIAVREATCTGLVCRSHNWPADSAQWDVQLDLTIVNLWQGLWDTKLQLCGLGSHQHEHACAHNWSTWMCWENAPKGMPVISAKVDLHLTTFENIGEKMHLRHHWIVSKFYVSGCWPVFLDALPHNQLCNCTPKPGRWTSRWTLQSPLPNHAHCSPIALPSQILTCLFQQFCSWIWIFLFHLSQLTHNVHRSRAMFVCSPFLVATDTPIGCTWS